MRRPSDQKLFYWLLHNHREAQLENYNNNVPISKSDIHHLRPPNWKKRIATCEFTHSGRNGLTKNVSKFTVISNVREVDDNGTVASYDPYNASRNLQPCASQVSHAKITVHRNGGEPGAASGGPAVSHSYHSYKTVGSSFMEQRRMNSLRSGITASHLRSPHSTMSSIRSARSTPRPALNPRVRRNIDFSVLRNNRYRGSSLLSRETQQSTLAGDADGKTTGGTGAVSASDTQTKAIGSSPISATSRTSFMDTSLPREDSLIWNEELQMLGHRIAEDCDKAFQSSIVLSESGGGQDTREGTPYSLPSGAHSTGRLLELSSLDPTPKPRPWDNRPLPPTPAGTITPASSTWNRGAINIEPIPLNLRQPADRRTVSEPLYARYAHGGPRPLPSIYEDELNRSMVSLNSPKTPAAAVDNQGLMNYGPLEHTIRVVHSPANGPVPIPEPLNVRKVSKNDTDAAAMPEPLKLRKSSGQSATATVSATQEAQTRSGDEVAGDRAKARVSSWFRRTLKEEAGNTSLVVATEPSMLPQEQNNPAKEAGIKSSNISQVAAKKKGLRMAFAKWKNAAKNEQRIEMSILGKYYSKFSPIVYQNNRHSGRKGNS